MSGQQRRMTYQPGDCCSDSRLSYNRGEIEMVDPATVTGPVNPDFRKKFKTKTPGSRRRIIASSQV